MATRNFVPRANGEGKIGTPTKHWGSVYADAIHGDLSGNALTATDATNAMNDVGGNRIDTTYIKKDSEYLGYRQPSTAYAQGAMANHATLPAGWFLECTTAGTTGSGTLTITTPTVGGTVSDGTVTWTISRNLSVNGGVLVGNAQLTSNADNNIIRLRSSINGSDGGGLILRGKNTTIDSGSFTLIAQDNVSYKMLFGFPDGRLLWGGNSLDKSAVVAESLGANIGYRKFASGLTVAWRNYDTSSWDTITPSQWTYPISFTTVPTVVVTGYNHSIVLKEVTNTYCKVIGQSGTASGACFWVIGF